MKHARFMLIGTGAIALAAQAINLGVPKAVHAAMIAALVRDVDNPARDTFQASFDASCTATFGSPLTCTGGLTVPSTNGSGQPVSMLVIEYVSGRCPGISESSHFTNFTTTELLSFFASGGPATSTAGKFLHELPSSPNGYLSSRTRIYAGPGTTLITGELSDCVINISGYFVTP